MAKKYRDPEYPHGGGSQTHELFYRSPGGAGWKPRTYNLTPGLIARIDDLAAQHEVGQSDLVRFLLECSLRLAEIGELEIPTRQAPGRVIDYGE